MTRFGLDIIANSFPEKLRNKRIGLLCHSASIASDYSHAIEVFLRSPCKLSALFGPQHGMYGQTQDNMVEWEGTEHPTLHIPVYSLYGSARTPNPQALASLDDFVIDLQDVGARPYTYIWTVKNCMDACQKAGIGIWVLDRPNPIGIMPLDGPMLNPSYFSFVGGAPIPLCHRMTLGEMALLLQQLYYPTVNLHVVWMKDWWRNSMWHDTELPWVLPSPNMPTVETAIVYPGMVLLEATNMSEGRGTTRPFEIIGAPYFKTEEILSELKKYNLRSVIFRAHDFIPTFQKWQGTYCRGIQLHVTDPSNYESVFVTAAILQAVFNTADKAFEFKKPPYEYDLIHMPFDILSGDESLRNAISSGADLAIEKSAWQDSYTDYLKTFKQIARYPENKS